MQITNDPKAPFTVADVDGNEHQYTPYSLYEEMLCEAENLFGRRGTKYEFLGIEHHDKGPSIWFPDENRIEKFIIQLNFNIHDNSLCYQLAHETLHSLAPQRIEDTNNFEEGIAVYFSGYYIKKIMKLNWTPSIKHNYKEVFQRVKSLINSNSKSFRRLKRIRENNEGLSFSKLNDKQLRSVFPKAKRNDIRYLKEGFKGCD